MHKLLFIFLLFFVHGTSIFSQQLPIKFFNATNGMINARTHCIQQDGVGFVWAGTDMGIMRYDGVAFKYYPSPGKHPHFASRICYRYGKYVVFAVDKIGVAVCYKDSVRFFIPGNYTFNFLGSVLPINDTTFLVGESNNDFFLLKNNTATHLNMAFGHSLNRKFFNDYFIDKYGRVWLCGSDRVVVYRDIQFKEVVSEFLIGYYINSIRALRNGDVLIVSNHIHTKKGAVFRVHAASITRQNEFSADIIFSGQELDLQTTREDKEGNIWVSSDNHGVFKLNSEGRLLNHFTAVHGFNHNIWDIFFDNENNMWVVGDAGIQLLTNASFISYDFTRTEHPYVRSGMFVNDSTFLASNGFAAYFIGEDQCKEIPGFRARPLYLNECMIAAPDGKIWMQEFEDQSNIKKPNLNGNNYYTSIFSYNNGSLKKERPLRELPHAPVAINMDACVQDSAKNLWCCTFDTCMHLYKNGKFYPYTIALPNNKAALPVAVTIDKAGYLWAMLKHEGIVRCAIKPDVGDKPYRLDVNFMIPDTAIAPSIYLNNIIADKYNNIWYSYGDNGLHCLPAANKYARAVPYNSQDYISSSEITELTADESGNIWIGTKLGLDKIEFTVEGRPVFQKNLFSESLCGKLIYFIRTSKHTMYIGTTGCVAKIDLNGIQKSSVPPPIYITGVWVNNRNIGKIDSSVTTIFNPSENNIRLDFIGIDFKSGEKISYQYILHGVDKDWNTTEDVRSVTYPKIPSGTYTFEVRAVSADKILSLSPAKFTFTIRTPFYRTIWFYMLMAVIAVVLTYLFYRYRINQIIQMQKVRSRIARDLHDDIGATVSSIGILANLIQQNATENTTQAHYANKIAEDTKYVQETLGDIVWSINPNNDQFDNMLSRMQRFTLELFEAKAINYQFTIMGEEFIKDIKISMERRQHFYMIFKEAINNLIKYSNANLATIAFYVTKKEIRFVLTDNGIGFDTSNVVKGNGLKNMKERAALLKAKLKIMALKNQGTQIDFTMPV